MTIKKLLFITSIGLLTAYVHPFKLPSITPMRQTLTSLHSKMLHSLQSLLLKSGMLLDSHRLIRLSRTCGATFADKKEILFKIAESGKSKEVVSELIAGQANINARDQKNQTPLHRAALLGNKIVAQALVEAGADRTIRDDRGRTALEVTHNQAIRDYLNIAPQ